MFLSIKEKEIIEKSLMIHFKAIENKSYVYLDWKDN